MMKFAGLALLAVLAAPAVCLDWTKDPVSQADPASAAVVAAPPSLSLAGRPGGGGGGTAGRFDTYVFSLEWTPAFCEGKSGLPECTSMTSDRFDARNLALHGLWPDRNDDASHDYGYCGVDPRTQALDRAPTWCRMPAPGISDGVMSRLTTAMPGTASCLQNHEWYKHGSCSGYSPDEYFARAAELVEAVAATDFGRFLSARVGRTVPASDLLDAFESSFGAGTRRYVSLSCTTVRGVPLLLDVRLHLSQPLRPAAELAKMILPVSGAGNCPASFQIDAPGR